MIAHRRMAALVAAGFLLTPVVVHAQTVAQQGRPAGIGMVQGTITSADHRAPMPEVQVRVEGTQRGAITDANGRFRIAGLPAGEHTLIVQQIGLTTTKRRVVVEAGGSIAADFQVKEAAVIVSPVVVSATREVQRRSDASATIEALSGIEIRQTRASHPAGILNRVPGVHVSDLSGEGHSMAMRQPITTKPMYLYLEDGIPTRPTGFFNHNALYEVNIPQSGGLEVLKGPGTALYGSDAIGGVVNVLTRPVPTTPSAELTAEGGAHGYRRALGSIGTTIGNHGLRADLNLTHSDNWKDDSPYDRVSGTLRWEDADLFGLSSKTVITGSKIDQFDVPSINATQFASTRDFNRAPIAYRKVRSLRVTNSLEKEQGAGLWALTSYARDNGMDLLPQWQLSYDPQTYETSNKSYGFLAKYRRDFDKLRGKAIVGVDGDMSPGSFDARRAIITTTNGRALAYRDGETHYDYDVTFKMLSPYLHTEASLAPGLRVDLGVRADFVGYDYDNNLTPMDTGAHRRPADTQVSYTHLSPKVGVSYELTKSFNVFASYRHGFRAPSQGQLFTQNSAVNSVGLEPVKVDSYETGVRGEVAGRVVYQLSLYDMKITDDIITYVTPQNTREALNAGKTRHRGIEGGLGIALHRQLRLDASYSVSEQRYLEWVPQAARPASGTRPAVAKIDYSGNNMETAPRDLANVFLNYTPRILKGGRMALEWSKTGRYPMDAANTPGKWYEGHSTMNFHFNANLLPTTEVFLRVSNLRNEAFAEIVTYDAFQKEQYIPGSPRMVFAGMRYNWQR